MIRRFVQWIIGSDNQTARPDDSSLFFEPMEPKLLLSADALSGLLPASPVSEDDNSRLTLQDSVDLFKNLNTDESSLSASINEDDFGALSVYPNEPTNRLELVFIDASAPDYMQLLQGIENRTGVETQVFVLQPDTDGASFISETLAGYHGVDAIHLLSHGDPTGFQLGNDWIGASTLDQFSPELARWGQALNQNADILIYGCNLAYDSTGQRLLGDLALLTGADIAASNDLTGHASLSGDWDLEYSSGNIETSVIADADLQELWLGTLATETLNPSQDTYINKGSSTANYGTSVDLYVDAGGGGLGDRRILIQFDLSSIPPGATITSATLYLNAIDVSDDLRVEAHQITAPWNGSSVSWSNQPTEGALIDSYNAEEEETGQHDWNLTSLVQAWLDGTASNYGVMLGSPDTGSENIKYQSNETGNPPRLVIVYENAPNNPPTATDNTGTVTENGPINAIGNVVSDDDDGAGVDSDPEDSINQLVVSAVGGNAGNVGVALNGNYGSITIGSDGNYSYTLNDTSPAVQALAAGQVVTDTFSYTLSDQQGGTDTATLTITIAGTNDAPVISGGPASVALNEVDAGLTSSGDFTISDIDTSDTVTASVNGLAVSGTSDRTDPAAPSDAELQAMLTVTPTAILDGTSTSATLSWNFDSTSDAFNYLAAGETLVLTYTVRVEDSQGATADETVSITVTGSNDAPTATANSNQIATSAVSVSGNMLTDDSGAGLDSDIDGDTLNVISIDSSGANQYGNLTLNDADGSYTYTLNNTPLIRAILEALGLGQTLTETYTYTVSDGQGGTDTATLTIVINGSNNAPSATPNSNGIAEDAANISGNMLTDDDGAGIDSDIDGDALRVSSINTAGANQYGNLTLNNPNGSYTYALDNLNPSVQALGVGETLTEVYSYTVTDDNGGSDTATLTITITGTNDDPIATADAVSTTGNTILNGAVPAASDVDGIIVSYSLGTTVTEGSLAFNGDGIYRFDPGTDFDDLAVGASRDVSFTYTAFDNDGAASAEQTVTITVTGSNDAPTAVSDSVTTDENTILNGNVPAASDIDGTIVGYALGTTVVEGNLTFNNDGIYSFDPGTDFDDLAVGASRDVTFTYTATDNDGSTSAEQTVTITVTGSNDAPVAASDSVTTDENTILNGNVPAASDIDGTIVGYALGTTAAEGNLTFNGDGSYSFDPGTDFDDLAVGASRDVAFTYTATDNDGAVSAEQTVTITVTGSNDAPTAVSGSVTTDENTTLNGNVPAASDIDGTIVGYALVTTVTEGSLTFNGDGSYSFDPGTDFDDLAVGASRDVTFTYTATDNDGAVGAAQTVTITVTGTNDSPVAVAEGVTTGENTTLNANVPVASDVDGTIVSYALGTTVTEGNLTFNSDGSYSFDPGTDFDDLAVGASRDVSFTYTAIDNDGAASTAQTVTITVTGTNDLPVVVAGTGTTTENIILNGAVPAASDVDGSIISYAIGTTVTEGSLAFNGDGSYSFDPGTDFDGLAVGASRDVTFTYTATDNVGAASAPQTVSITVTGVNDEPVATANSNQIAKDGGSVSGNMLTDDNGAGLDSDIDGDTLSVISIDTSGANQYGNLTFNADGSYTYTLGNTPLIQALLQALGLSQTLVETYSYTVSDGQGGTDTANLTIVINGNNNAPIATPNSNVIAEDATNVSGNMLTDDDGAGIDSDINGDTLRVSSINTAGANQYGNLTLDDPNGSYTYTLDTSNPSVRALGVGETLTEIYRYTVADDNGGTDTATLTITITGTNDGPIAIADSVSTTENSLLNGAVPPASDIDGTIANYALGTTVNAGMLIFNNDGSYSFDTGPDFDDLAVGDARDVTFTYTATDNDGAVSAEQTVTITVTGTNDIPMAVADTATTDENAILNAAVPAAFDVDGTIASYALGTTVTGGNLTFNNDGSYSFDPGTDFDDLAAGASRDVTFTYTAIDNDGAVSAEQTITITITGTNDIPVAVADILTTEENTPLNGAVPAASDIDGTIAGYTLGTTVTEGSLTFNSDGSYSFDPGTDFDDLAVGASRDVTFIYTATDNDGATSAEQTVTIKVTGTNDAPVAASDSVTTDENAILSGIAPRASDIDGTIVSYALGTTVAEGNLTFNSDGSYSFDPGADFDDLAVGASREVTFSYTATDNDGAVSAEQTVTITVTGNNDAPEITGGPVSVTLNETDTGLTSSGSFEVTDIDVGDRITASVNSIVVDGNSDRSHPAAPNDADLRAMLTVSPDAPLNGSSTTASLSWNFDSASEAFNYLAAGETLELTYTVRVEDSQGAMADEIITITVTGTNDAPTISTLPNDIFYERGTATVPLNDLVIADVDGAESITANLTLLNPQIGQLSSSAGGTYNISTGLWTITGTVDEVNTALANLLFIPNPGNAPNSTLLISIDDGDEDGSGPLLGTLSFSTDPIPSAPIDLPVGGPDQVGGDNSDSTSEPEASTNPEEPSSGPSGGSGVVAPLEEEPVQIGGGTVVGYVSPFEAPDQSNLLEPATTGMSLNGQQSDVTAGASDRTVQFLRDQITQLNAPFPMLDSGNSFINQLDNMRKDLVEDRSQVEKLIGTSLSVSAGLSVGYVVWLARSGIIMSSVLSSLPAWRFIDPLPILGSLTASNGDEDSESLESMVTEANDGKGSDLKNNESN
ncbi:MAG: VCBS domain-containing protein [Pseudomonas sp.]|nr:VCBS domain-containing protein [Pseudomonas sp.]